MKYIIDKENRPVYLQIYRQIRDDIIAENYQDEYDNYFAIISKNVFMNTVMNKKTSGKISLGI